MQIKKLLTLFIAALVLMAGVSCSDDDSPDVPDRPVTSVDHTLFMFFPWSNTLLSDFRRTVQDMTTVVSRRTMHDERVIVYMATSQREAVLFELKQRDGQCYTDTLRHYADSPFTSRSWLSALFSTITTLAPATHYGMVIGCHGLAWVPVRGQQNVQGRQYAPSSVHNDIQGLMHNDIQGLMHYDIQGPVTTRYIGGLNPETQIETSQLAGAMADAGLHTEYLLFDACYMSSVEVAYEFKDVTHYLIASPTEVISYGFPYLTMGNYLLGTPNYKGIVDSFINFYSSYSMPYGTVAVTDCTQLDALAYLAQQINIASEGQPEPDGVQTMDGYSPPLFYDLGHYMSLKSAASTVLSSAFAAQLDKTVPYKGHTPKYISALRYSPVPILHFSGLTTSQSSRNYLADKINDTAWYKKVIR